MTDHQPTKGTADPMTETETETPTSFDPLAVLTIAELDAGSRQLGTSLVRAVTQQGERYEDALAVVLWLHRRRTDRTTEPGQLLAQLRRLTFVELTQQLAELTPAAQEDGDPLGSAPGSPSPGSGASARRRSAT